LLGRHLAKISTDDYARLEQAAWRVPPAVLAALAAAPRLGEDERSHLLRVTEGFPWAAFGSRFVMYR